MLLLLLLSFLNRESYFSKKFLLNTLLFRLLQPSIFRLLVYVIVCLFEYTHVRTLLLHVYSPNQCLNIYEDVNARIHVISICARELTFPCCIYVYAYVVPNHVVSLCALLFTFPCCIYMRACNYLSMLYLYLRMYLLINIVLIFVDVFTFPCCIYMCAYIYLSMHVVFMCGYVFTYSYYIYMCACIYLSMLYLYLCRY